MKRLAFRYDDRQFSSSRSVLAYFTIASEHRGACQQEYDYTASSLLGGLHSQAPIAGIFSERELTYMPSPVRKLVLITSFRLVPKSVTLNDLERRNGVILRYFSEFGWLPGALRKS